MSITVEELRVPNERALFEMITQDTTFMELIEAQLERAHPAMLRANLLRSAMRLSADVVPEVFKALQHCRRLLGLGDLAIEVFCEPTPTINAFVLPPSPGGILVGLSAAAIERLDEDELRFVLGHELGHAILGHGALYMGVLQDLDRISPLQLLRLFAWKRFAELSADRIGLIACANPEAAVRTLFKLGSGLTRPRFIAQAAEALKQFEHLELDALEAKLHDTDWISSHPCGPLRIRALELFARSQLYRRAHGIPTGNAPDDSALNAETHRIMGLLEPSFVFEEHPRADSTIRHFMVAALLVVALADGQLTPEELELLRQDAIPEEHLNALANAPDDLNPARLLLFLLERPLVLSLSRPARVRLLERLVVVALADGALHAQERAALDACAEHLSLSPLVVTELLAQTTRPLD